MLSTTEISFIFQTGHHRLCIFNVNLVSFIVFRETNFTEVKANYTSRKPLKNLFTCIKKFG